MNNDNNINVTLEIMKGLEIAYEKMLEFKIYKKSKLVVKRNGVILELDPNEELELLLKEKAMKDTD